MLPADADFEPYFRELEKTAELKDADATCARSIDVRYVGQGYELNVPAGRIFSISSVAPIKNDTDMRMSTSRSR